MILRLPAEAVEAIVREVATWGRLGRESGVLLLASADEPLVVDAIGQPLDVGITRRRDEFAISGLALAQLFAHLDECDRVVAALIHSHGKRAFLSDVDLEHGFSVEGFVSSIVPSYADPPSEVRRWGWWIFLDGRWQDAEVPEVFPGGFLKIEFDEAGARAR